MQRRTHTCTLGWDLLRTACSIVPEGGVKKKRTFIANTILRFSVLLPGEGPLKRAMFALGLYLCVRSKDRKVIPGEVLRSE